MAGRQKAKTPPKDDMAKRAEACGVEIQRVLKKHRCAIVPHTATEYVGANGTKILVEARWGVFPIPDEKPGGRVDENGVT